MSKRLANYLIQAGVLPPLSVERTSETTGDDCVSPIAEMIRNHEIDDLKLARWCAHHFNLPLVELSRIKIDDTARDRVPRGFLEAIPCIPLGTDGDTMVIAIADPTVLRDVESARDQFQMKIEVVLTTFTAFWEAYRAEMIDTSFWDNVNPIGQEVGDESTLINLNRG
jgi:hypothetical protein